MIKGLVPFSGVCFTNLNTLSDSVVQEEVKHDHLLEQEGNTSEYLEPVTFPMNDHQIVKAVTPTLDLHTTHKVKVD